MAMCAEREHVILQVLPEDNCTGDDTGSSTFSESDSEQAAPETQRSPAAAPPPAAPATLARPAAPVVVNGATSAAAANAASSRPPATTAVQLATVQDQALHASRGTKTREFEINVEKDGEELGVDVLQHDQYTLLVNRVKLGPLWLWNRSHPDLGLHSGDRIVEVNGQRGSSEQLISVIRADKTLRLGIRRLLEYGVSVPRTGRLGLDVAQHEHELKILRVGEGPFQNWNKTANYDLEVKVGDSIIEANGLRGTSAELLEAIQGAGQQLELILARARPQTSLTRMPAAAATAAAMRSSRAFDEDTATASPPENGHSLNPDTGTQAAPVVTDDSHVLYERSDNDCSPGYCAVRIDD